MTGDITPEDIRQLREFKSEIIEVYWERFGTFYLHLMPHPDLVIGKRGLVGDEKEMGIILVLGPKAVKSYTLDETFLYCELQFGYTWEKITAPWDCVFRLYDKTQNSVTQMRFFSEPFAEKKEKERIDDSNVIKVDFGGKKLQ